MLKGIQIGQCILYVDEDETHKFYSKQPLITENCQCENCQYFGTYVVNQDIQLFKTLQRTGVILERQPNIHPDGVSCVGDTEKFNRGYMGNYNVIGDFDKTQKESQTADYNGQIKSVRFEEKQDDFYCSYHIVKIDDNRLDFQFWVEIDRLEE